MRCLVLVVAAGCGFSASDGSGGVTIDSPPGTMIDAAPAIDAPPDARPDAAIDAPPPTWMVVETLTVPCLPAARTSTTVLTTTGMYRLRARGTCTSNSANNSEGDAEYTFNAVSLSDAANGVDSGIAVDDSTPGSLKQPRWGAFTSTHQYEVPWIGTGATITALFHDSNPSNNAGSLSLDILVFQ